MLHDNEAADKAVSPLVLPCGVFRPERVICEKDQGGVCSPPIPVFRKLKAEPRYCLLSSFWYRKFCTL